MKLNHDILKSGVQKARNIMIGGVKIVVPIVVAGMANELSKKTSNMVMNDCYIGIIGYEGAVDAIMNSDMWSSDKRIAVSSLPTNRTEGFYRAIVSVVKNNDTWSSDKRLLILKMSHSVDTEEK